MSSSAPKFNSITTFRLSLAKLCKKEKFGYASCIKDICEAFEDLSFDDIWEMNTRLKEMGDIRFLKIRIKNAGSRLSSADGFRLMVCCDKADRSVTFLNIYPKRGKLGQLNQSKEESTRQLELYLQSRIENDFTEHDISDELKEKPKSISSSTLPPPLS